MNEMQHNKYVAAIRPAGLIDNNTAVAVEIDARNYDYVTICVLLGATDIAMTALKVQQATTSGGVFGDIAGATFAGGLGLGGATLALPSATDDGQICVFHIDMRGKEPFLKVVATYGDGASGGHVSGMAILSRGKIAPDSSLAMADGDVCLVP